MKKKIISELILELAVFVASVGLIVIFWENNVLLTFLLVALLLIVNQFWYKKYDYVIYIAAIILGSILDIVASNSGVWEFLNPTIFGIPLWLPIAWIIGAVTLLKTYETFRKMVD